jgi:hypothetical protein
MNKTIAGVTLAAALASLPVWAGPTEITQCQTISQPGSYVLANDIGSGQQSNCLVIAASSVTIDLAGFEIFGSRGTNAIVAGENTGIAVRNGSISVEDGQAIALGDGSIVEGLRITASRSFFPVISAKGIVRGNTVLGTAPGFPGGPGISATGVITNNYVSGVVGDGIAVGAGSTVIGNTSVNNMEAGIRADCPANRIPAVTIRPDAYSAADCSRDEAGKSPPSGPARDGKDGQCPSRKGKSTSQGPVG